MKKKTSKEKKPSVTKEMLPDLPQNILKVGERVLESKNIYIHQKVYAKIHKFAANKTENEHGGVLVGRVINEMNRDNIIIEGFIEAKYNAATPTTLTFTHDTWDYFHSELEKRFKGLKIVGWIHTHPNFGIFLSENDKFIQQNFFSDSNQVAYVVDPIQNDEGFYFWIDGNLERCPGFYIFDKVGSKIKQKPWEFDEISSDEDVQKKNGASIFVTALLAIITVINLIFLLIQTDKISVLEKKIDDYEIIIETTIGMDVSEVADLMREQNKNSQAQQSVVPPADNQGDSGGMVTEPAQTDGGAPVIIQPGATTVN
ncbi:MAG: Mov34/MPN/PAD-1 family protein [Clostridia bacterium]|nr:Mov34/MPN/PAD-1 family protein [Clostridia bacterium]